MKLPNAEGRYLAFLQELLAASNRDQPIKTSETTKRNRVSAYALQAAEELDYIEMHRDHKRAPCHIKWKLEHSPTEVEAIALIDATHEIQEDIDSAAKLRKAEKSAEPELPLEQPKVKTKVVTKLPEKAFITQNNIKVPITVVDGKVDIEVGGDKITINFE